MERRRSLKEAFYDAGSECSSAFPIQYNLEVFDGFRRFLTVNKQLTGRTVASLLIWLVEGFRFPRIMLLPKAIPSRQELGTFFDAISSMRDRAIFLMFASSGLGRQELLGMGMGEINL